MHEFLEQLMYLHGWSSFCGSVPVVVNIAVTAVTGASFLNVIKCGDRVGGGDSVGGFIENPELFINGTNHCTLCIAEKARILKLTLS